MNVVMMQAACGAGRDTVTLLCDFLREQSAKVLPNYCQLDDLSDGRQRNDVSAITAPMSRKLNIKSIIRNCYHRPMMEIICKFSFTIHNNPVAKENLTKLRKHNKIN